MIEQTIYTRKSVSEILAESSTPEDEWLWCIYCTRVFQAHHLSYDYLGNKQGCAFCECAGLDVAIFIWDHFSDGDPLWPTSSDELTHGQVLTFFQDDAGTVFLPDHPY